MGFRRASPALALEIESATKGLVGRGDLRPDLWCVESARPDIPSGSALVPLLQLDSPE